MSAELNPAAPQSPQATDSAELEAYARALGITDEYLDGVTRAVYDGQLQVAQVVGFTPPELDAVYLQGMELVRQQRYGDAGNVFLFLAQLDRKDPRYLRGLALVFHCLHEFGWADTLCDMVLRRAPNDIVAQVLQAEAALYLSGKKAAHRLLTEVVARQAQNNDEQLYLDRAKQILAKLRI